MVLLVAKRKYVYIAAMKRGYYFVVAGIGIVLALKGLQQLKAINWPSDDNRPTKEARPLSGQSTPSCPPAPIIDFVSLPLSDRVRSSSLVVLGSIEEVSPTRWNQDNGEYWEDIVGDGPARDAALPYYTIKLVPIDLLMNKPRLKMDLVVTVLGRSPVDCRDAGNASSLVVGKKAIVFARQAELAWRHGQKRAILELTSDPSESLLVQGEDGFFRGIGLPDEAGLSLSGVQHSVPYEDEAPDPAH